MLFSSSLCFPLKTHKSDTAPAVTVSDAVGRGTGGGGGGQIFRGGSPKCPHSSVLKSTEQPVFAVPNHSLLLRQPLLGRSRVESLQHPRAGQKSSRGEVLCRPLPASAAGPACEPSGAGLRAGTGSPSRPRPQPGLRQEPPRSPTDTSGLKAKREALIAL